MSDRRIQAYPVCPEPRTRRIEDAVNTALARAHKTAHNLRWFKVVETAGPDLTNGKVQARADHHPGGFHMDDWRDCYTLEAY